MDADLHAVAAPLASARPPMRLLYPFRFRDPLTGRWVRARYKATPEEIAARVTEAAIIGPAEIRRPKEGSGFNPMR